MSIKIATGLEPGHWNRDVDEFIVLLQEAVDSLDVLGQIQAMAGGQNTTMQAKSNRTFKLADRLMFDLNSFRAQRETIRKETGY